MERRWVSRLKIFLEVSQIEYKSLVWKIVEFRDILEGEKFEYQPPLAIWRWQIQKELGRCKSLSLLRLRFSFLSTIELLKGKDAIHKAMLIKGCPLDAPWFWVSPKVVVLGSFLQLDSICSKIERIKVHAGRKHDKIYYNKTRDRQDCT